MFWHWLTYPFKRGPRRPLTAYQPQRDAAEDDVPLGMEATDLDAVARTNRRNDALERVTLPGTKHLTQAHRAHHVQAMPDDETYAARYHRAFKQKGA